LSLQNCLISSRPITSHTRRWSGSPASTRTPTTATSTSRSTRLEPTAFDTDTGEKKFHYGFLSKLSLEDFKVRIEQRLDGHEYAFHQIRDKLLADEDEKLKKPDMRAIYDKDLKELLLEAYRSTPAEESRLRKPRHGRDPPGDRQDYDLHDDR
jgi:hypothetical protein